MIDATGPVILSQPAPAHPHGAITADDFDFDALIDMINPLQHIPVVGTLYRKITGDEMGAPASIAGGALYFGVFGFLGALGNEFLKAVTGEDVGERVMSLFDSDDDATPTSIATASSDPYRAAHAYQTAQALALPNS
ncbi:MAG: hypothetical protein GC190_02235 [Alphaproteobacteria bacterium]|nr:hypothetical protein [Alphaproteobacteria bacterium]